MKADEKRARDLVRHRAGGDETFKGWCEPRVPGWCQGRANEWQHRRARTQGGPWTASNGIAVCGSGNYSGCHGYIHQNPHEAWKNGWTVKSWQDWRPMPVVLGEERVILLDDGTTRPPTDEELIALLSLGFGVQL